MINVQLVGVSSGSFGNLGSSGSFGSLGAYNGPLKKDDGGQFNCVATKCYAIGSTVESVFKSLQKNLNRFATKAGFRTLVADGLIGQKTVTATVATLIYLKQFTGGNDATERAVMSSPIMQTVSRYALELRNLIKTNAEALNQPTVAARKPTPAQKAEAAVTQEERSAAGDGGGSFTWAWWALGGLAAVGVVAVGVSVARRHSAGGSSGALFPHSSY